MPRSRHTLPSFRSAAPFARSGPSRPRCHGGKAALLLAGAAFLAVGCGEGEIEASGAEAGAPRPEAAGAPNTATEDGPLGTIEASFDGDPRTWYAVRGEARTGPWSSAMWMDLGQGPVVSLSGLDTPTPPVETFESDPATGQASLGDYDGTSVVLVVPLPGDGGLARYTLPEDESAGVSVLYLPDAASVTTGIDMTRMYSLVEGVVEVEDGELADGRARTRGTFSGTLESMEGGNRIQVTGGRFEARAVPSAEALGAG